MAEKHLTIAQLCERLGVPASSVYKWNSEGGGPPYMKIGKHARYRLADVEAWENSRYAKVRPV